MPIHRQAVRSATQVCRECEAMKTNYSSSSESSSSDSQVIFSQLSAKNLTKKKMRPHPPIKVKRRNIFKSPFATKTPTHINSINKNIGIRLPHFGLGRSFIGTDETPMPVHRQAVRKKCRFNCCPGTTTLLRSSGGVGWFSCQQLSILHPSCRRKGANNL